METDDLIEISAEDDSLLSLQQVPNSPQLFSNSKDGTTAFSCSPLVQIPRSSRSLARPPLPPIRSALECANDTDATSPCSLKVGIDKENAQMNSSEAVKLGIERQQMKRKKKGGGYNLRKSLAWDRAFFTEEGVLDPQELSILSGTVGSSRVERLSIIHEDVESASQRLESISESRNSLSVGDYSIKKSPASTLKSRKMEGVSSMKARPSTRSQASPLTSPVKPKAISAHDANKSPSTRDANRSASKYSGCPRPVASSSLKRPLQPNISRVANRDPKVSKVSGPKENPPLSNATSRSSTSSARSSKHSHTPQPAVQAPKTVPSRGSCGSAKISRNEIKPAHSGKPTARSTVQQASRNLVKVVPEKKSSAVRELPKAGKANDDSRVLQNPAVAHPVNGSDGSAMEHAVSVARNGNNVKDTQTVQSQPAKPSGLRMPSPSLRYFEQSKPSGSQGSSQRGSEPGNLPLSGTPSHQKPPLPPRDRAVQASSVYGASPMLIKSNSDRNDGLNKETQAIHITKSCDTVDCQQLPNNMNDKDNLKSQDCVKSHGIEKISHTEDIGSGKNDNSLFLQENSNIIEKGAETESLAAKASMVSYQEVERAEDSVSGGLGTTCLGYKYVEDAVDSGNTPKDQLSTFPDYNKKSEENEISVFRNNEGGDCSVSIKAQFMEDTVPDHTRQVHQDHVCSIPRNDTVVRDSTAESQRPWVNHATLAEEKQSSSSTDYASLKVEATPADYDILHSQDAGTNDDPNGIYGNLIESAVEDAGMQPLEADDATFISMSEVDIPQIINCEANTGMEEPAQAPVQLRLADGNLLPESKGEVCVPDACSLDKNPFQMQLDNSLSTNLLTHNLQPEDASGDSGRSKDVTVCTEVSRPTLLQVKKTSDQRADQENQTPEASQNPWECNNRSTTNGFTTCQSRTENEKCNQTQLEIMKLDGDLACDQHMIEETFEEDAEVQESDGRTCVDMSNVITCPTHEASPENEFSGDRLPIEETTMEDAEVQDCDGGSFVNIRNVISCQTPGRSEENIKCGQSQSNAMKPESEPARNQYMIEETIIGEDGEVQECDGSSFVDISNLINSQVHKESEELMGQPKSDHFIGKVPSDYPDSCLNSSLLPPGICSAEDRDASGDTSGGPLAFVDLTSDKVKNPECLSADEKSLSSSDVQETSENIIPGRVNDNCCMHGDQVSKEITISVSPVRSSGHEIRETATTSDFSAINEKSKSQVNPSDSLGEESMVQDMDVEWSEEDDILSEVDKRPDIIDPALQHEMESETLTCSIENVDEKKKADAPAAIKLPADAAPFSEEWLAAIEAAGEEILTKKSGAVQHSPPEKAQPEPGPWSPVKKRKNQEIGPFDCTKYTNKNEPST